MGGQFFGVELEELPDNPAIALRGWWFSYPNIFQAAGLAPSGGHILSSSAKKEYGKKDAARVAGVAGRKRPSPSICVANALFD